MGELMKKIKFLFAIIFIFIFQLCIKCYGVDITSNVMYEKIDKKDRNIDYDHEIEILIHESDNTESTSSTNRKK